MSSIDIDQLTNAQLDRLQERLTLRTEQRKAEKDAAWRAATDTSPLRPHIGNGGHAFGNAFSRRQWDKECIEQLKRQTVPFAIAPGSSVVARDGTRLTGGQELRPSKHLNALLGAPLVQVQQLVTGGFVLAKETTL